MTHIEYMRKVYTTILLIESLMQHFQKEVIAHQQSWSYRELKGYTDSLEFLEQRRQIKIRELC